MKKLTFLLLVALLAISINANSQTFYYVGGLQIIPANPTTSDIVKVNISGNFASTGSYILNHSININGSQIDLIINCADPGGFTVIVPHDTIFTIGMLPAGTYSINLSGSGLGDYVPAANKTFTVNTSSDIKVNNSDYKLTSIYPNPCNDNFKISLEKEIEFETELYNSNGSLILKSKYPNNEIIDIKGFEQGIYFIKIVTENQVELQKIVKN